MTWEVVWHRSPTQSSSRVAYKTESPQVLTSICPTWARRLHHTEKPFNCNCHQNNISSDCVIFGREFVYASAITLVRRLIHIYIDNIVHCTLQQYGTINSCRFRLCRIIFDLNMWKQLLLLTSKLTTFDLLVKLRRCILNWAIYYSVVFKLICELDDKFSKPGYKFLISRNQFFISVSF